MKQMVKRWRDTSPLMEPMCRVIRATRLAPPALWQHLAFTGTADFTVAGNRVRMLHFGAEIENSLFWAGYGEGWEATTLLAWERLALEHDTIYDVGANTGLFALSAQAANPRAKVHAFEPLPAIVERLRANIALNGFPIEVHAAAVSDEDGTAEIKLMQAEHEYSACFGYMEWMEDVPYVTVPVPVVRLDSVIAQGGGQPGLIKLDVERHEPQALRGLWAGLNTNRPEGSLPAMVIEVLDDACAAAIAAEIAPYGYRSYVIREGVGITADTLRHVPGTMNWLLLPEEAGGFAAQLAAAGGISHKQLRTSRPTGPRH